MPFRGAAFQGCYARFRAGIPEGAQNRIEAIRPNHQYP
jgi:hypothetical protein